MQHALVLFFFGAGCQSLLAPGVYLAHPLSPWPLPKQAGANIGLFALRLLLDPRLEPSIERVLAFEPLPPTAAVLESNLLAHGVAGKVGWGYGGRCRLHSAASPCCFCCYC